MPVHGDVVDLTLQTWMEHQVTQGTVGPTLPSALGQDLRCPCHTEIPETPKGTAPWGGHRVWLPLLREDRAEKVLIAETMVLFAGAERAALGRPHTSSQLTLETAVINHDPIHSHEMLHYCL